MRRIIYKIHDGKSVFSANINDIDIYFGGLLSVAIAEIPKSVFLFSDFHNHISVDIIADTYEFETGINSRIIVKLYNSKVNLSRAMVFNIDVIREKCHDSEKCFVEDWRNKFREFEHDCKVQLYVGASVIRQSPSKEMMIGAYIANDLLSCMEADSRRRNLMKFDIDKVIYHDPATIVYWKDGTKTVVKCDENEEFDPEKGLAMAIAKKALGNKGNYYNKIKKWLPEPDPEYEEFCKFEEGVRRTNPTWSDSLKALSDAIKKANLPKSFTDALFFGGKYRKCNTCEYQAAAFNPCNGCKDGSEYKEVKTNDYLQL